MKHHYTEEQKARIRGMIAALVGSLAHLERATAFGGGLCLAIRFWQRETGRDYPARDARILVQRAIAGYAYLENWQRKQKNYRPAVRDFATRQTWLNQLIKDCEAAL